MKSEDKEMIEEIIYIEEEAFGKNGGVDEWILKPILRYGKVFVLKDKGKVVSIAEFMQKFDSMTIFLYGLCTRKESRGKGYAKEILKRSEEFFREKKIKKIDLTVAPDNIEAINLYKNLNYKIAEKQKNEYGVGIDRLLMRKKIDENRDKEKEI